MALALLVLRQPHRLRRAAGQLRRQGRHSVPDVRVSRCCSSARTAGPRPRWCAIIGWAFAVWGVALYWWAALLYLTQNQGSGERSASVVKAVVMAGGEGTRLRPMTANQPKPLLPVVNRPIMEHVLRLLKRHGFEETVVTVQFLAALVRNYFGDGEDVGMSLQYATEETPLGTAGSVKNAEDELQGRHLPRHLRRRADRHGPDRDGAGSTRRTARWSPSGSPGCPTRWSSASSSRTRTGGSSGSSRSRPGGRCSPTR